MTKFFKNFIHQSALWQEYICVAISIIMILLTFSQVVMRYVFNNPVQWASEVTIIMLIWFGYLGISISEKENQHIAIHFFYDLLPTKLQFSLDILRHLLCACFSVLMIKYGFFWVSLLVNNTFPATGLSKSWLYFSLVVCGLFLLIYSLYALSILIINYHNNKNNFQN